MGDLSDFEADLKKLALKVGNGSEAKKFMRVEGGKLKKLTKAQARATLNKKTGNLFKGISKGRAKKTKDNVLINVYGKQATAPHTYLLNNGHIIVGKDGSEHEFKEGEHFLEKAQDKFIGEFENDVEDFIDRMLKEHNL